MKYNNKINKDTHEYFYDVPEVEFIYKNSTEDPELEYKGQLFNYYELEDVLYLDYEEDIENDIIPYGTTFEEWIEDNHQLVYNYLDNMLNNINEEDSKINESKKLNEGTSNFGHMRYLPLLVFDVYDYLWEYMLDDPDYPNEDDFESEEEFEDARDEFEYHYFDNYRYPLLSEEDFESLKEDLEEFNSETKDIAYELDLDENGYQMYENNLDLEDIMLDIESGYYEGAYIGCDDEQYFDNLDEEIKSQQIERFKKFLKEMKKKYGLLELGVTGTFSSGETIYHKVDESKNKDLKEDIDEFDTDFEYCAEDVADGLESGWWHGQTRSGRNWGLIVNGEDGNQFSPSFADAIAYECSYPVRDGHFSFVGLDCIPNKSTFTYTDFDDKNDRETLKNDLLSVGCDEEEIEKFFNDEIEEIEFYIDYEIDIDDFDEDGLDDLDIDDFDEDDFDESLNLDKYDTKEKLKNLVNKDGTYSVDENNNVKNESFDDGYMVSFFKDDIPNEYISKIAKKMKELFGEAYLGVWNNKSEISFHINNLREAMRVAEIFNQQAIWDCKKNKSINNNAYDKNLKFDWEEAFKLLWNIRKAKNKKSN